MTEVQRSPSYSIPGIKMHSIAFLPPAEKYFKKLKEKGLKDAFREAIVQIQEDPYCGSAKKGDLAGVYGYAALQI